ncbi:unnamed protein product, partial [Ectocarpus sp. 12 AP-2014]
PSAQASKRNRGTGDKKEESARVLQTGNIGQQKSPEMAPPVVRARQQVCGGSRMDASTRLLSGMVSYSTTTMIPYRLKHSLHKQITARIRKQEEGTAAGISRS